MAERGYLCISKRKMLDDIASSSGKGMCTSSSDRDWLDCPVSGQEIRRGL